MTGKSREVANMLKRRRDSIACVQETKWKGAKAKEIGEGYKMYYFGTSNNRNGVAVILGREWHDKILKVDRISDKIINVKLAYGNSILNVISAYAPQVGCPHEQKSQCYEHLEQRMRNIKPGEEIIIGADLTGHVGRDRSGFEQEHGGHSFGDRNEEGDDVLRFAEAYNLGIVNTFFQKHEEHLITYKSGSRITTIYYILVKRTDLKVAKDCKVIPGESIAMQHRILVMDYKLKTPMKKQTRKLNSQIGWWNLKKEKAMAEYQASDTTNLDEIGLDLDWNKIKDILISTAKEKLGQTSGKGAYNEKESLWWNEDTRSAITAKEKAFKAYQKDKSEEQHCAYKEANKATKRAVAMAKEEACEELYTKLDTREGAKYTSLPKAETEEVEIYRTYNLLRTKMEPS